MKRYSLILLMIGGFGLAQNTYIDPVTTGALKIYSDNLKNKQNETIERQTKLQKAQGLVATQMALANSIQDKIYKGLSEVSGTLQNGLQIKEIYSDMALCRRYSSHIAQLVSNHPQYSIFAKKSAEISYERVVKIGADASALLASGSLNLATSGDRHKLLYDISQNVKQLKIWLIMIKINIESAIEYGFWRSINPFQGYINTDKDIVRNAIDKYHRLQKY